MISVDRSLIVVLRNHAIDHLILDLGLRLSVQICRMILPQLVRKRLLLRDIDTIALPHRTHNACLLSKAQIIWADTWSDIV